MKKMNVAVFSNILLVSFFMVVITLPLVVNIATADKKFSENEKRVLSLFPGIPSSFKEVTKFPELFENYYNDHFGFREKLIYRYHRELAKRFGVAGSVHVLQGQEGWLFYTAKNILGDFMGKDPLSEKELHDWYEEQLRRKEWLAKKGVAYLTFSPPNKQTIYPEKMPEGYLSVQGETRLGQLLQFLKQNELPFFVNVQDPLLAAKSTLPLYHETDTHWNRYGAYIASREVFQHLKELFPHEDFKEDFSFSSKLRHKLGGDLARMLMIQKKVRDPYPPLHRYRKCSKQLPFDLALSEVGATRHHKPAMSGCSSKKLKAIMFCDSFVTYLRPFFSENFSNILYLRQRYSEDNIEEILKVFKADVVIEELVERNYFLSVQTP